MSEKEYIIVQAASVDALERRVNDLIQNRKGEPVGGVCAVNHFSLVFYQAVMVEHDQEPGFASISLEFPQLEAIQGSPLPAAMEDTTNAGWAVNVKGAIDKDIIHGLRRAVLEWTVDLMHQDLGA